MIEWMASHAGAVAVLCLWLSLPPVGRLQAGRPATRETRCESFEVLKTVLWIVIGQNVLKRV